MDETLAIKYNLVANVSLNYACRFKVLQHSGAL